MRAALVALLLVACAGCVGLVPDDEGSPSASPSDTIPGTVTADPGRPPTETPSPSPSPAPQEPTLFVLVERGFGFNRTAGDAYGPMLAIGSHCGLAGWTLDPARVDLLDWSPSSSGTGGPSGTGASSGTTTSGPPPDPWGPSGIVVGAIRHDWIHNTSFGTYGSGAQVYALDAQAGSFAIPGAFGGRVVANVTTLDGAVSVNGQPVPVGGNVTVRVAYTHTTNAQPPSRFAVEERIQVTDAGPATVTKSSAGRYCI